MYHVWSTSFCQLCHVNWGKVCNHIAPDQRCEGISWRRLPAVKGLCAPPGACWKRSIPVPNELLRVNFGGIKNSEDILYVYNTEYWHHDWVIVVQAHDCHWLWNFDSTWDEPLASSATIKKMLAWAFHPAIYNGRNVYAVQTILHLIPGLAPRFLYANPGTLKLLWDAIDCDFLSHKETLIAVVVWFFFLGLQTDLINFLP